MKSLCVMPVYNEVERLPLLLESFTKHMPADYFIIINNGSTDGSETLIKNSGFEYISLHKNHGIGYGLRLGAEKAMERGCDIVVHIAGNGKMLPEEMGGLMKPILENRADHVAGSRFLKGGRSPNLPLFRKVSIPLVVNNLVRLFFKVKLTDATNGYRAYRTTLLRDTRIKWKEPWLFHYQFEYYIYAKALKLNYRCVEVPSSMVYPESKRNYSKIKPIIGWWELLESWILVGLGIK
jgi:dolichol-phosphate mannosyltransferase